MQRTFMIVLVLATVSAVAYTCGRFGWLVDGSSAAASSSTQDAGPPPAGVGAPGRHHRALDRLVGEWSGAFTTREGPDAPPVAFECTIRREWTLGGRYVREDVVVWNDTVRVEGIGYFGYDNFDGQYEIVWMDDMSTAIQLHTGTYHPDEGVIHMKTTHRDTESGRLVNSWSKLDLSDPDRHVFVGYATDPHGRTYRASEGEATRAPAGGAAR